MKTWPETISPEVESAFSALLKEERRLRSIPPKALAARADLKLWAVHAFERGSRQPNLATFITLAWSFEQDPRELFDKLLLRMKWPPGSRMILHRP